MNVGNPSLTLPTGYSFEISDLLMARDWSEYHDLHMWVELDYCADDRVYEEVLAFYPRDGEYRRWIMWNTGREVVVQPLLGRAVRFNSMAQALGHAIRIT